MADKEEVTNTDSSKPSELPVKTQKGLLSYFLFHGVTLKSEITSNLKQKLSFKVETKLSCRFWAARRSHGSDDDDDDEEEEGEVDDDDEDEKARDIEDETEKKPQETTEVNWSHLLVLS